MSLKIIHHMNPATIDEEVRKVLETKSSKDIERRVMEDQERPCLYGVAGPCFHPACLEAHFETLKRELLP